ncbi:LacI family DNA-binding transcriptional regulator [Novosphingobium sp. RL4]|uniref:LacI family DNA-binding transcriptional regulator n=1 Tax=Novosphingobium sp. RL4 TaxID=3109595 RepID=UPI002D7963BC|nr:LacI family DNA-binding transcriptional regulator [Novosphingobium sp. RL4]WRT94440.1 LacI family DNA-binding transcriptional regulator [Novosphingobium sp. RL4]
MRFDMPSKQRQTEPEEATRKKLGKPANIRAVAAAAGVSTATVSRALSSPERLGADTLERVQAAIQRLQYTPNVQAQNMRTSQTRLIIALVPDIASPFFSEIVRGIERIAHRNDYSVLLGDTEFDEQREQRYAKLVTSRQADGLITMLPHIPSVFAEGRAPIVNACECVDDPSITSVSVDNFRGACAAMEYLIALGHRRIAYIGGPESSSANKEREAAYVHSIAGAGEVADPDLIVRGDYSVDSGTAALGALFAKQKQFTAVFCANDEMALGAINAIKQRGLQVPKDISVIGFDDIKFARHFDPPLTTVAQPASDIGMEAARLLIEILSGSNPPPQKRVYPAHLIVRASTGPAPAAAPPG